MKEENNTKEITTFSEFNVTQEVLEGLRDVGFDKPTDIQQKCIPLILEGRNILASASTGTGKTAAYAIPILNGIFQNRKEGIQALIITPTRELAQQVDEQFWSMGYHTDIPSATIYGGADWGTQEKALERKVNIITATPGRLMDFMRVKRIDFSQLDYLVIDEADRMLDMGFIPDIKTILKSLPQQRQNLMFSATMPPKIEQLAGTMMSDPVRVNVSPMKPAEGITQKVYNVDEKDKLALTLNLFDKMQWNSAIIFTATKRNADVLAGELKKKGVSVTSIHGDRSQEEREVALKSFSNKEYRIIVATDVISRGIDIDDVSHVINYSVPRDTDDYIHRVGRTARADATGEAITFVSGQDRRYMHNIYKELGDQITRMELPEEVAGESTSKEGDKEKPKGKPKGKGRGKPSGKGKKPDDKPEKDKDKDKDKETPSNGQSKEKDEEQQSEEEKNRHRKRGKRGGRKRGTPKEGQKPPEKENQGQKPDNRQKPKGKGGPPGDKSENQGKTDRRGSPGNKEEKAGGPQKKGQGRPPKGKSGPPPKEGGKGAPKGKRPQKQQDSRRRQEMIDQVKSPDMDKVEQSEKSGVWRKIKSWFGGK